MSKLVLISLGFLFVGLGGVGLVLPLMPTTPFLLLAAACFARSSPRFHDWLLNIHVFGALIRNWQETRSIPREAKLVAILSITLVGGLSVVLFVEQTFLKILIAAILLFHAALIACIKSTERVELRKENG